MANKKPPSERLAECCGTCEHWEWEYEGDGECDIYPDFFDDETSEDHSGSSTSICDDFKPNKELMGWPEVEK